MLNLVLKTVFGPNLCPFLGSSVQAKLLRVELTIFLWSGLQGQRSNGIHGDSINISSARGQLPVRGTLRLVQAMIFRGYDTYIYVIICRHVVVKRHPDSLSFKYWFSLQHPNIFCSNLPQLPQLVFSLAQSFLSPSCPALFCRARATFRLPPPVSRSAARRLQIASGFAWCSSCQSLHWFHLSWQMLSLYLRPLIASKIANNSQ